MIGRLDTLRWRIVAGFASLALLLLVGVGAGVYSLWTMRDAVVRELGRLQASNQISTAVMASTFAQIRAAEQYLNEPSAAAAADFHQNADSAYADAKALGGIDGLTVEDRLAVNRVQQIQAQIEVTYALAHALADVGRAPQAEQEEGGVAIAGVRAAEDVQHQAA